MSLAEAMVVAIPLCAMLGILGMMADAMRGIEADVKRFVDACDENERKARER